MVMTFVSRLTQVGVALRNTTMYLPACTISKHCPVSIHNGLGCGAVRMADSSRQWASPATLTSLKRESTSTACTIGRHSSRSDHEYSLKRLRTLRKPCSWPSRLLPTRQLINGVHRFS